MPAFDAIFFDIGSTLIPSAKIIRSAAAAACQRLAHARLIARPQDFLTCYLQADARIDPPHISHIYSDMRIVSEAERLSGLPPDWQRRTVFLCGYRESLRTRIKLAAKYVVLFAALQRAGVQCGIISDGSCEGQGEVLFRLGLLPIISPGLLFISEAVGCTKKNPEIYRRALAAAGVPAARALMVGDRLDLDVAVPQSLGMKAVLLRAHVAPAFVPAALGRENAGVRPDEVFDQWQELERWLRQKRG